MEGVPIDLKETRGLVASIIISGVEQPEFGDAWTEMRVANDRAGYQQIEYRKFHAALVESGRDSACIHALEHGYDWVLQIDADMVFPPESCIKLMEHLFVNIPHADAVGGYCNLKSPPFLPTIDTGTGTWEEWYPGSSIVEVIRTGAAFLMCKTSAFTRFGPPWFRVKISNKPLDALMNVDNFARCKLDGSNPLMKTPEWTALMADARQAGPGESGIGEDSGFCDRLKASGGRIYVDTDIVVGHLAKQGALTWTYLKASMKDHEAKRLLAVGVM